MSDHAKKVTAAFNVVAALAEAIRELGEVPSGHLYARLMSVLSLEDYQTAINLLQGAELISVNNHLITWNGPK